MLHDSGFEHFYDLRGGQALSPVLPQSLREQDFTWMEPLKEKAEEQPQQAELTLSVQGLSCIGCIWLIDRVYTKAGGGRLSADIARGEMRMEWQKGSFDPLSFARELQRFCYLLGPQRPDCGDSHERELARRAGGCGAFAMNAMAFSLPAYFGMPPDFMFAKWFDIIAAGSATLALLVGGSYFADRAWRSLKVGVLHIDTPITLGIMAAYLGSIGGWITGAAGLKYFDFVAMFIFLMLGGRWLQQAAVARNRRKLLRDPSIPETVTVGGKAVAVADLKPGDLFEIRPGQAAPVAAELAQPSASISLEWINGESEARERTVGQMLPSGALNIGTRSVLATALEGWDKSTLRALLEAGRGVDQRDLALEKLLRYYLLTVVFVGFGGGLWWWLAKDNLVQGLQVMISIFVVSCPCALGVAAPFADEIAASRAAKLGVFVRSIGLWKKLSRVRKVLFDKTGTLTLENPVLQNTADLEALSDEARSALRHLVSGNLHPVSRSLFDQLGPGQDVFASCETTEVAGHGLAFEETNGRRWELSRPRNADGGSDVEFLSDGQSVAGFRFRDELRPETVEEVRRLQSRGRRVIILSGDREEKVAAIAQQLGLPAGQWHHSLTPNQKAKLVAELDQQDTLYIGDGANDSLAFDAATCSGSPVTGRSFLEHKADFYFLGHSMRFVTELFGVSVTHRHAIHGVFGFALLYNIITVIAGLMGMLSPIAAAILMPLSSVATLSIVALVFRSAKKPTAFESQNTAHENQHGVGALVET
jgi:Cu2+-exporting ATPase